MILTKCPCCAAPLPPTSAKQCSRCKTRYCGAACQEQHWKEGGHDKLCRKIRKGGGAEEYNANKRYTEAVAVAAEACAEDTKGQTCYICTQALHWKTKEGLVRMCACRGTAGFVHVSCLAEQAKILVAEAEENRLGNKVFDARWARWNICSMCEQSYHGVVACALGWACWKTYVGRPETDWTRVMAVSRLGGGLSYAGQYVDALSVYEAELSVKQRVGTAEDGLLLTHINLATTYRNLGRRERALQIERDVYSAFLRLRGEEHRNTHIAAINYASSLTTLKHFEEAKAMLRKLTPVARRVRGESDEVTLKIRWALAQSLYEDPGATLDDNREAVATFEEIEPTARRVLGSAHPDTVRIGASLRTVRAALRAREAIA